MPTLQVSILEQQAGPQGFDAGEAEIIMEAGHSNPAIAPAHTATAK